MSQRGFIIHLASEGLRPGLLLKFSCICSQHNVRTSRPTTRRSLPLRFHALINTSFAAFCAFSLGIYQAELGIYFIPWPIPGSRPKMNNTTVLKVREIWLLKLSK